MTLTVENGSAIAGADSFATVAEFSAWSLAMFNVPLTGVEADQEAALRRAFAYMAGLNWLPDTYVTFGGAIPQAVINAQCALARAELASAGMLTPDVTLSGRKVLVGLDVMTWQVQSAPNTVEAARPVVSMAMDYLKPYIKASTGTKWVERA